MIQKSDSGENDRYNGRNGSKVKLRHRVKRNNSKNRIRCTILLEIRMKKQQAVNETKRK